MKIKHLTNETFTVNENPFATALKKAKAGAEYFTGDDGAIAGGEGSCSLFLIKLAFLAAFSGEINKSVLTSLKSGSARCWSRS